MLMLSENLHTLDPSTFSLSASPLLSSFLSLVVWDFMVHLLFLISLALFYCPSVPNSNNPESIQVTDFFYNYICVAKVYWRKAQNSADKGCYKFTVSPSSIRHSMLTSNPSSRSCFPKWSEPSHCLPCLSVTSSPSLSSLCSLSQGKRMHHMKNTPQPPTAKLTQLCAAAWILLFSFSHNLIHILHLIQS